MLLVSMWERAAFVSTGLPPTLTGFEFSRLLKIKYKRIIVFTYLLFNNECFGMFCHWFLSASRIEEQDEEVNRVSTSTSSCDPFPNIVYIYYLPSLTSLYFNSFPFFFNRVHIWCSSRPNRCQSRIPQMELHRSLQQSHSCKFSNVQLLL